MRRIFLMAVVLTLAAGSASAQMGPTVPVGPAPNKPFDEFQQDNYLCRQYADQQVAGLEQRETNQVVGGAVVGTVLGAGLGAAFGGGRGAAIGAGTGAVVGTVGGSAQAQQTQAYAQRRYDTAFGQCMYARGDQVAGYPPPAASYPPPPPPAAYYPPPPPPPPPVYASPPPGYYPPPGYPPPPASYAPPPPGYYPPPPGYYPQPGYPPPAN